MAYRHPEAFRLMTYRCESGPCGDELVWNSRDGVTPFVIRCATCGGEATHVAPWERDPLAPDHQPSFGDRVFVDATPERLLELRAAGFEKAWVSPVRPTIFEGMEKAEAKARWLEAEEFREGQPDLRTVGVDIEWPGVSGPEPAMESRIRDAVRELMDREGIEKLARLRDEGLGSRMDELARGALLGYLSSPPESVKVGPVEPMALRALAGLSAGTYSVDASLLRSLAHELLEHRRIK